MDLTALPERVTALDARRLAGRWSSVIPGLLPPGAAGGWLSGGGGAAPRVLLVTSRLPDPSTTQRARELRGMGAAVTLLAPAGDVPPACAEPFESLGVEVWTGAAATAELRRARGSLFDLVLGAELPRRVRSSLGAAFPRALLVADAGEDLGALVARAVARTRAAGDPALAA